MIWSGGSSSFSCWFGALGKLVQFEDILNHVKPCLKGVGAVISTNRHILKKMLLSSYIVKFLLAPMT